MAPAVVRVAVAVAGMVLLIIAIVLLAPVRMRMVPAVLPFVRGLPRLPWLGPAMVVQPVCEAPRQRPRLAGMTVAVVVLAWLAGRQRLGHGHLLRLQDEGKQGAGVGSGKLGQGA